MNKQERKLNTLQKKKAAREERLERKSLARIPNNGLVQPKIKEIKKNLFYIENIKRGVPQPGRKASKEEAKMLVHEQFNEALKSLDDQ